MTTTAYPYAPFAPGAPSHIQALRESTAGVRLLRSRFGVRKALSKIQVSEAAEVFHAEGNVLSASKKLLNTQHEDYANVTRVLSQAVAYWKSLTVSFPITGIRLMRKDMIPAFNAKMDQFRAELRDSAEKLQQSYDALRADAQERLGDLFNPADYPTNIGELFELQWDYPSVEPDARLKELSPEIYEQAQARVAAQFESAIAMAEQAFAEELQKLVSHLVDRLSGKDEDGAPKVLNKSAVENLTTFFTKFKDMNIGNNAELSALVEKAENIVAGVDTKDLRKNVPFRHQLAEQLGSVQTLLDAMVIDKPTRAIDLGDDDE